MKKVLSFILSVLMLISLSGCGKSKAAKEADNLIAAISNFSATDDSQIKIAEDAVAALNTEEYEQLENIELLREKRNKQQALVIENKINKIGTVSLNSSSLIDDARKTYNNATEEVKELVDNYSILTSAEATLEKLQQEEAVKEYKANILYATYSIIAGAAEASNVGEQILNVWHDAIAYNWNTDTSKYTTNSKGQFVDMDTALSNLYADENIQNSLKSMEDNKIEVADRMKKLKNPPKEYEDAYDIMKDFYSAYLELMSLASSPIGNYLYYSSSYNNAAEEVYNYYNKILVYADI